MANNDDGLIPLEPPQRLELLTKQDDLAEQQRLSVQSRATAPVESIGWPFLMMASGAISLM